MRLMEQGQTLGSRQWPRGQVGEERAGRGDGSPFHHLRFINTLCQALCQGHAKRRGSVPTVTCTCQALPSLSKCSPSKNSKQCIIFRPPATPASPPRRIRLLLLVPLPPPPPDCDCVHRLLVWSCCLFVCLCYPPAPPKVPWQSPTSLASLTIHFNLLLIVLVLLPIRQVSVISIFLPLLPNTLGFSSFSLS